MKIKFLFPLFFLTFLLFSDVDLGAKMSKTPFTDSTKSVSGEFSRVRVRGPINVALQPSSESKIAVQCPEDLADKISVSISGGIATILFKDSFFFSANNPKIDVIVHFADLKELQVSGFGKVVSVENLKFSDFKFSKRGGGLVDLNLNCDLFDLSLTGPASATLEGRSTAFRATLIGSPAVNAREFVVKDAELLVKGSSKISLHANSTLRVHASGSSQVLYAGSPELSVRRASGSSQISPI